MNIKTKLVSTVTAGLIFAFITLTSTAAVAQAPVLGQDNLTYNVSGSGGVLAE